MGQGQIDDVDLVGVLGHPRQATEDLRQAGAAIGLGHPDDQDGRRRRHSECLAVSGVHRPARDQAGHEGAVSVAIVVTTARADRLTGRDP